MVRLDLLATGAAFSAGTSGYGSAELASNFGWDQC